MGKEILSEVESCDLFIALIGRGYNESDWCKLELAMALSRYPGLPVFPYRLDHADVKIAGKLQAPELPEDFDEAVEHILADVQNQLVRPLYNQPQRSNMLLGGSREAVVDRIRHVPKRGWPTLVSRMADVGVSLPPASHAGATPHPREFAERVFAEVQRAVGRSDSDASPQALFVRALAEGTSGLEKKVLNGIVRRIGEGRANGD